jgi:phosphatidylinositol glycan class V
LCLIPHRNVGFLRYWTPPNIPLFILAAPLLYILVTSGIENLAPLTVLKQQDRLIKTADKSLLIQSMALSQLVLAVLAISTYHIQIITRISSGYPLWYFWLAQKLESPATSKTAGSIVIFMVMYAAIQGALFASFLPPA